MRPEAVAAGSAQRFQRWRSETIIEFLAATQAREVPFVVARLVPAGDLTLLVGAPKQGKTMLAEAMAIAVASGKPFAGEFEVRQGPVLLVLEEDRREEVRGRLEGFARGTGLDLLSLPIFLLVRKGWRIDQPDGIEWLRGELRERRITLVVIDCLSAVHRMHENERDDMSSLLRPLTPLLDPTGAALLFTHHERKAGKGGRMGVHASRGSGELAAIARSLLHVTRNGKLWRVSALGNYDPPDPFSLALEGDRESRVVSFVGSAREPGESLEDILLALLEQEPGLTTEEIRRRLEKRYSVVQKALEGLETANRVERQSVNRSEGDASRRVQGWFLRSIN
jgi:hypothetical protein